MRNRSQWLSGFLAGRGYYYQVRLKEIADKDGQFVVVDFFDFNDEDCRQRVGGLKFSVAKGTKVGDTASMVQIAETIARRLNVSRIPHRPSTIPVLWGARIMNIVKEICGIGCKADPQPIERLKEIHNVCAFFATAGGDMPLDDEKVPDYIRGPMLDWQRIQAEGLDGEEPLMAQPGQSDIAREVKGYFRKIAPFLSDVQMQGDVAMLYVDDCVVSWEIGTPAPVFASDEIRAKFQLAMRGHAASSPEYRTVLTFAEGVCDTLGDDHDHALTVLGQLLNALDAHDEKLSIPRGAGEVQEIAIPAEVLDAARVALSWSEMDVVTRNDPPTDPKFVEAVQALPYVAEAVAATREAQNKLNDAEKAGAGDRVLETLHAAYIAAQEVAINAIRRGESEITDLWANSKADEPAAEPARCEGFVVDDATGDKSGCDGSGSDCPACNVDSIEPAPVVSDTQGDAADSGWSEGANDGDDSNGVGNIVGQDDTDNVEGPL